MANFEPAFKKIESKDQITAERLRKLIKYDPQSGLFVWLPRKIDTFKTARAGKIWNARFSGKIAGYISKNYVIIRIGGQNYKAHRLAWLYMTGEWPKYYIDHKNRNEKDNRWKNLRSANHSENMCNRGVHKNNKSGEKGVCWHKREKKWRAQIQINGKRKYIGSFTEKHKAVEAYKGAAAKNYGEFANI